MRLFLAVFWLSAWSASASGAAQPVDELAERVEAHLDQVRDFEARFRQRYHRQVLGKVIEEGGVVYVKKPGRMRWEYLYPESKLFITEGTKTYFYLPEEKQVFVNQSQSGALGLSPDSPLALLAGRSRLRTAFEVEPTPAEPEAGGAMMRLAPRQRYEDIEKIDLEVEPSSGRILRVLVVDSQGNQSEFLFEDIKENQNLPDTLFLFTIPSGVDIVLASESSDVRRR